MNKIIYLVIGVLLAVLLAACEGSGDHVIDQRDEHAPDEAGKTVQVEDHAEKQSEGQSEDQSGEQPAHEEEKAIWETGELAKFGYVDVTLYGADPTGQKDSTAAIQAAVDAAYANYLVTFFPEGTYLVSDTIKMERMRDSDGFRTRRGHALVGSTKGERPTIKLTDNNPRFQDASQEDTSPGNPTTTRAVMHFWTDLNAAESLPEDENGAFDYNQVFRGIDIDLGEGNPGAVGIRHRGAEGSSTQDVTIYAREGFAGIYSLLGSGGSITNVEIYGGKYGVYARKSQPMPVLTGMKLIGQHDYAIYYAALTPLTIVGFEIEKEAGPVIKIDKYASAVESWGNLGLIDGKIEVKNGGTDTVLVENTDRMVYMQNVYTKHIGKVSVNRFDGSETVISNPAVWSRIEEFAYAKNFDTGSAPKIIDMVSTNATQVMINEASEAPPSDLRTMHVWDERYWTVEHADVVNVKDFGAAGDGFTDDTKAIQAAIDAAAETGKNRVVLPKGSYRVSGTIYLREHTKLFGVARHLSILEPKGWVAEKNTPVIQSYNSRKATNVIADLKIELYGTRYNIYAIEWQSGRHSIAKDIWVCWDYDGSRSQNVQQWIRITGNGGGKWYNPQAGIAFDTNRQGYRFVLVEGTSEPLNVYMLHNQHIKSDAISEIRNATNVRLFGVKTETQTEGGGEHRNNPDGPWPRALIVTNSANVAVHGYSGMGQTKPGQGLFEIIDSHDVIVTNMGRWSSHEHPLDQWHYILLRQNDRVTGITADTTVNMVKLSAEAAQDTEAPAWQNADASASQVTDAEVTLSWTYASDDTGVVAYEIYINGKLNQTVTGNALTMTISGLDAGQSYQFKIEARDAAGNQSSDGPEVTVSTGS